MSLLSPPDSKLSDTVTLIKPGGSQNQTDRREHDRDICGEGMDRQGMVGGSEVRVVDLQSVHV